MHKRTDPKGIAAETRCPLELVPPVGMEEAAWVHKLGATKYGSYNWRDNPVSANTYVGALMRHCNAWRSGEDLDPESGRSHLAHIIANCNIILDAMKYGTLDDDRPKHPLPAPCADPQTWVVASTKSYNPNP